MVFADKQLSISVQCDLLGINRSSFYYKPVEESAENLSIMRVLDEQSNTSTHRSMAINGYYLSLFVSVIVLISNDYAD